MDPSAAADYAHAESFALADEVGSLAPVVDIRAVMHAKQREFVEYEGRMATALAGRQGGKTFGTIGWQVEGLLETPGALSPYFALTKDSCIDIAWPEVVQLCSLVGIGDECLHEATRTLALPNGSRLKCTGTDDVKTIQTSRGKKFHRVVVDEMGAQPEDFVGGFITAIIWPALIRFNGQIRLIGTCGAVEAGYWHGLTNEARPPTAPRRFKFTAWDNPGLGSAEAVEAFVQEYLDDNALTRESPMFRREWLAEWCSDEGELVYPFDLHRNGFDTLPVLNAHKRPIEKGAWRYVIGVDPGARGWTAIVVVGAHPELTGLYVMESEKHKEYLQAQLAERLRELQERYKKAPIVVDAEGLGSSHAMELTRVHALGMESAEKTEKTSAVHFTRNFLLAGRLKVRNGACNDQLRMEWAALGWDEKHLSHQKDRPDHCADACLYAVRRLRAYTREERQPEPERGTPEYVQRQEDAIIAARLNATNRSRRSPMWDR